MTDESREHLEDLSNELAAAADEGHEEAADLHDDVNDFMAISDPTGGQHEAMRVQLSDAMLHFEVSHPSLTAAMQRVIDSLSASGI